MMLNRSGFLLWFTMYSIFPNSDKQYDKYIVIFVDTKTLPTFGLSFVSI